MSDGSSSSPASVSTAARIAAIGVRSSCETSDTKRRRIVSMCSRSVTSRTTPIAAGSPCASRWGTERTVISRTCSGVSSPPKRRTAEEVGASAAPAATPASKSRSASGWRTRSTRARRGAPAGTWKSASAAGFASRRASDAVHDEETDGHLLEDGAGEEARLLAALALGRDEPREARERDEDLLRLLRAARRRRGLPAGGGLGDARPHALELARVPLPDERDDERRP